MKIMIAGGAGFVGSHLAEYLLKKHHKIVICTKTSVKNVDSIRDKIELEKIDVTNYTKLEKFIIKKKPDVVIQVIHHILNPLNHHLMILIQILNQH